MVNISITQDDLYLLVEALDSADFYVNGTEEDMKKFYEHKDKLRWRLTQILKKWDAVEKVNREIKWAKNLFHLGRGFHTTDEFLETLQKLLDERHNIIEGKEEL